MQNNIGEARRSYALATGQDFTQDIAAAFFGVSPSGYKKWEQGKGKLNGEILCAIADKYQCSVDYLLCRTEDPTPYQQHDGEALTKNERRLLDAWQGVSDTGRAVLMDSAESVKKNFGDASRDAEAGVDDYMQIAMGA